MAYHPDLLRLLNPGSRYTEPDSGLQFVIERHRLSDVVLPTGQVTACDPLAAGSDAPPLPVEVPPGRYPLQAWVASHIDGDQEIDRRVAALQLVTRDVPIARWELAAEPEQIAELGDGSYLGFGVDAGCATLSDPVALQALDQWDYDRVEDTFIPLEFPERPVPGAIEAVTDPASGANVIVVSSGWGDGIYPTFVCYGASGEFCGYVIDFLVTPPEE